MIIVNYELIIAMRRFRNFFRESVPLKEISDNITNEELINAINESIDAKENLIPKIFKLGGVNEETF